MVLVKTMGRPCIKEIIEHRKVHDPLLEDVVATLNWKEYRKGGKFWIDCRDKHGNLYTIFPDDEGTEGVFVVTRLAFR